MTRYIDTPGDGLSPWEPVELARTVETGGAGSDPVGGRVAAEFTSDPAAAYSDPAYSGDLADLDRRIADYDPLPDDSRAASMDAVRRDALEQHVPSMLVETAMPALHSSSVSVRDEAEQILARGRGVEPGSWAHDQVALELFGLLARAGLHVDTKAIGRARVEDQPTEDELAALWDAKYGHGRRGSGGDLGASGRARKR